MMMNNVNLFAENARDPLDLTVSPKNPPEKEKEGQTRAHTIVSMSAQQIRVSPKIFQYNYCVH